MNIRSCSYLVFLSWMILMAHLHGTTDFYSFMLLEMVLRYAKRFSLVYTLRIQLTTKWSTCNLRKPYLLAPLIGRLNSMGQHVELVSLPLGKMRCTVQQVWHQDPQCNGVGVVYIEHPQGSAKMQATSKGRGSVAIPFPCSSSEIGWGWLAPYSAFVIDFPCWEGDIIALSETSLRG